MKKFVENLFIGWGLPYTPLRYKLKYVPEKQPWIRITDNPNIKFKVDYNSGVLVITEIPKILYKDIGKDAALSFRIEYWTKETT